MENEKKKNNIIIIGFKSSGKTSVGNELAKLLNLTFVDLDDVIEQIYFEKEKRELKFREIYKEHGEEYFRNLENQALEQTSERKGIVLATGGGTPMLEDNANTLKKMGETIYLKVDPEMLYNRITEHGFPAYIKKDDPDPKKTIESMIDQRSPIYEKIADMSIETLNFSPKEIANKIKEELDREAMKETTKEINIKIK